MTCAVSSSGSIVLIIVIFAVRRLTAVCGRGVVCGRLCVMLSDVFFRVFQLAKW